jgi:hypothetical protein
MMHTGVVLDCVRIKPDYTADLDIGYGYFVKNAADINLERPSAIGRIARDLISKTESLD